MRNRNSNIHESGAGAHNTTHEPMEKGTSLRALLKAMAVTGASAVLPGTGLLAQNSDGNRVQQGRIDVHHHWLEKLERGHHIVDQCYMRPLSNVGGQARVNPLPGFE